MVSVASILAILAVAPFIAAQTRYTCSLQLTRVNRKVNVTVEANLDSAFTCNENGRLLQGNGNVFAFMYTSECGEGIVKCNCSPVAHPNAVARVQRSTSIPQSLCANSTTPPFSAQCSLSVSQQQKKASLECSHNKPAELFCSLDDGGQVPCATGSMFPDLPKGNHCLTIKAQVEGSSEIITVGKISFQIRSTTSMSLNLQTRVLVDHEHKKATLLVEGTPVMCNCMMNGGAAVPCINGTMFTGLMVGNHQLALNCCSVMPRLCDTSQVSIEVKPTAQFTGKVTVTNDTVVAEFNSSAIDAVYRCRLLKDGKVVVDWVPCTSPHKFCGVKPGKFIVEVECITPALGTQIVSIGPFTVTEPPLLVTMLEGVVSDDNLNVVFTFAASQPPEVFLCLLDDGQFQPCMSPHEVPLESLACGMHNLKVMALLSSGVASEPAEVNFQKQCDVVTTNSPQPCNVDVHLVVSKDDGSVTVTYNSSNPNATLFCGVDAMKSRPCLNNSVVAMGLSPGMHVFHGRATCVTSPMEEDYFDLKNTTFTILPPDPCAGKQVTGVSVSTLQQQNQMYLNVHFAGADGLTVMCSFNGAPPTPCTSPHSADITHLCTGMYSLELVGFCNGNEVDKLASTVTLTRVPDPCITSTPMPIVTTVAVTTPVTTVPTPEPCRITDLSLKRSKNKKRLIVAFTKSSGCGDDVTCKCSVAGRKQKQCTNGITFKNAALVESVTVDCLREKAIVATAIGSV